MTDTKVVVIDDEKLARQRLIRFINDYPRDFQVVEAKNASEGLQAISESGPDIVFLDIEMPGLSGIEMLAQIEHRAFKLVFATAHDEFAITAFEENACDYLLKPFAKERLFKTLDRVLASGEQTSLGVEIAEHSILRREEYLSNLLIRHRGILHKIAVNNIRSFKAEDNYTVICSEDDEFLSDLSLNHLETRLDPTFFVRIHRSAIVNITYIADVDLAKDSTLTLESGEVLKVSRRNKTQLKDALAHWYKAPLRSKGR